MSTPNIQRLKAWGELAALGFTPVLFRHAALGVRTGTGAALGRPFVTIDGTTVKVDRIVIETPRWDRVYDPATDRTRLVPSWPVSVKSGDRAGFHYVKGRALVRFIREAIAAGA